MIEIEDKGGYGWFLFFMMLSVALVMGGSFYNNYYKQGFNMLVETSCDPEKEVCYERDCTNPDDCPPNQLSHFKRYMIIAKDFASCEREDCTRVCEEKIINCAPIACTLDEEAGEACTTLETTTQ